MHTCPVCGYDRMLRAPAAGYICPCCGVEFELDDDELSHEELRKRWIAGGMQWFSHSTTPPDGWNATIQLARAGFADIYSLVGGSTQTKNVTTLGSQSQVEAMAAAA